jgi:hypothetical protein
VLNWPSEGQFTVSRVLNTECDAHFATLAGAQRSARHLLPLIALLSSWLFIYHCVVHYTLFLGAFAKLRRAAISFGMSVRPSAWDNSAPTGRIFMKFYI